ncbi:hypothetical protein F0562_030925 [Nyssa sinensis]|uniref:Bidirectional sugar transporter SWEET n=1 Tax=Nyssa sinensis TaxID=561372 RepID=A0A5J5AXF6_9ASTE|nr:hypothetical protein F0562_030925 [Nyssa sinensis]
MGDRLRLAVGVMGNAASMLLYAAPILTFSRVIKKKSTEEFPCVPYIVALLNCFLYTWYGLPVVSYGWENFPVVTINGLGILLELSFILIYFWFASAGGKKKVAMMVIPVILAFCITAIISAFVFHDRYHRKVFVGSIGLVASVAMYGSPLVVVVSLLLFPQCFISSLDSTAKFVIYIYIYIYMHSYIHFLPYFQLQKRVIKTKSVEYMPFYLSFFSFLASSLWMAYGLLSHDLFLAAPNLVGSPLSILQLVLYCKYRKREIMEEPHKWDMEKNGEKSKQQLQLVVHGKI